MQYIVIGIALFLFLLIWPLGVIHKTEVSKSEEVNLVVSDPISVENNGTQMFLAEGSYLKAVELYVANSMQGETITFRIYDSAYKQLWETFYVVDEKAKFPGFVKINVDMQMQEGWEYYYTVEGLTQDLYLYYEDTQTSSSFANGTLLYGGKEMPGVNLVIRYRYTEDYAWWTVLLAGILLFVLTKGICTWIKSRFEKRYADREKEITVQRLVQLVGNPLVALLTILILGMIYPMKKFGVGALNYGFYGLGIAIIAGVCFYAINYKRVDETPLMTRKKLAEHWPDWVMAVAFAGVLWSCYEYMNGLYDIHHSYAACKMLTWFGIVLLCTFGKEYLWKIGNLGYVAAALVWRYFYIKPYLGIEEQEQLYRLQAWVIIVGVFVAWLVLFSIVRILSGKEKVTTGICLPYALLLGVWMALMVIFRNGRDWILLMAVLFLVFYYCIWRWEKRERLLSIFCSGVILNFVYMTGYCLIHRPYLRFRYNRFGMGFHTVTMTGYYLAMVTAAILVRLLVQYRKKRRWRDCYKEWCLLAAANGYLFLTLSRTGYLASALMQIFMIALTAFVWEKKKIKSFLAVLGLIVITLAAAFPAVFTAQRILPALCNDPLYSEVEVWEYVVEKGDPMDSELYIDITAFRKVVGNKLFGLETGNLSLSSIKESLQENMIFFKNMTSLVYAESYPYYLASEAEMYEKEDISNGRFDIFKSYMEHWNMTGHEDMGVPLEDGSIAVHAHNTYLQMIHDNGLPVGIIFILLGVVSFFYALVRYCREKEEGSYLLLTIAMLIAFGTAGMVEWIFQICNFFGIAILVVITPLLWKQKKEKAGE